MISSDSRLFIIKFALFLCIGFVLFTVILGYINRLLVNRQESGEYDHYIKQYEELFYNHKNANVIIIGSSTGTHGIHPKYLENREWTVFNFSLNAASPQFYNDWYSYLFKKYYQKPDIIIFVVNWFMFDSYWLYRRLHEDVKFYPWWMFWREFMNWRFTVNKIQMLQIRFSYDAREILQALTTRRKIEHQPFIAERHYNGYVPYGFPNEEIKPPPKNPPSYETRTNDERQISAFYTLLDKLERDDIKVIFVHVPELLNYRIANSDNVALLHKVAQERGIIFFDYNLDRISEINTNPVYFSGWGHLNEQGSILFTKLLNKDLQEILTK